MNDSNINPDWFRRFRVMPNFWMGASFFLIFYIVDPLLSAVLAAGIEALTGPVVGLFGLVVTQALGSVTAYVASGRQP